MEVVPDLVGVAEAAEILGWDKRRVFTYISRGSFPEPIAMLNPKAPSYLRWIVDEYCKDEPMTKVDKGLFALASYNAGAGRISELRRKAKRMGLDENKWFQNVEIVVAREIGRETVQYVGNIYKYYVAYGLIAERGFAAKTAGARH